MNEQDTTADPDSGELWAELEWRAAIADERCGAYWLAAPAIVAAVWVLVALAVWGLA